MLLHESFYSLAILILCTAFLSGVHPCVQAQTGASPEPARKRPGVYRDPVPSRIEMIQVEPGVQLEVLDFGGSGHPVVLLSGLGDTAHVFDNLAPLLTKHLHVYGVTRRGFGDSGRPPQKPEEYSLDRLGRDDLAALDALHLQQPVLVGHSIAGQELSWIANNAPDRVAGLIYLDAMFDYSLRDPAPDTYEDEVKALERRLAHISAAKDDGSRLNNIEIALHDDLPSLEDTLRAQRDAIVSAPSEAAAPSSKDKVSVAAFQAWTATLAGAQMPEGEIHAIVEVNPDGSIGERRADRSIYPLIMDGGQRFYRIPRPLLAIMACPHKLTWPPDEAADKRSTRTRLNYEDCSREENVLRRAEPNAHIVVWPDTLHTLFLQRPQDVAKEINAFIAALQL